MTAKNPQKVPLGLCQAISWHQEEAWLTPDQIAALNASGREVEVIPPLRRTDGHVYCRVWTRRVTGE